MRGMRVNMRLPGQRATDPRNTVTFEGDALGLPVPLMLHFLRIGDTETDEIELHLIGFELGGKPPTDAEQALAMPEITPLMLRKAVERFPHWVELARMHLEFAEPDDVAAGALALRRPKPARLDPEWFRMIASEYRSLVESGVPSPITTISKSHNVSVSAASRWVSRARRLGFLDGEDSSG
jgi:hypothetical protein